MANSSRKSDLSVIFTLGRYWVWDESETDNLPEKNNFKSKCKVHTKIAIPWRPLVLHLEFVN